MEYNFIEVMRNFNRMCKGYDWHCDLSECPIAALINEWEKEHDVTWDRDCIFFATEKPEKFVSSVMTWAQDNPVPIYPTVREVVNKICILMGYAPNTELNTFLEQRLTAKVANYFGIEPINKDKLVQ